MRYGQAAPLQDVRAELEQHPELLRHGPGAVLQAALLHAVESYTPVVDGLENDVREVERDVFSESRDQPTQRIYFLIREVLDFLIALEPLSAAVKRLTGPECMPWVDREIVPLFRDVDDALSKIVERGRAAAPAAEQRPVGEQHAGVDAPERGHPADLGVGRHRRHPDDRRRVVRDEPRRHPRCRHVAGFAVVTVIIVAAVPAGCTASSSRPTGCDRSARRRHLSLPSSEEADLGVVGGQLDRVG